MSPQQLSIRGVHFGGIGGSLPTVIWGARLQETPWRRRQTGNVAVSGTAYLNIRGGRSHRKWEETLISGGRALAYAQWQNHTFGVYLVKTELVGCSTGAGEEEESEYCSGGTLAV